MNGTAANVAKAALPLLGVILGWALARLAARGDRKKELRSIVEALLWELKDSEGRLGREVAILPAMIPSVDTLLERGLLMWLPEEVKAKVLKARSLVALFNQTLERYLTAPPLTVEDRAKGLVDLTEQAHVVLPWVTQGIQSIEAWMVETDFGFARRALQQLRRRPLSRMTPRNSSEKAASLPA